MTQLITRKTTIYIPFKDINGIPLNKYMRVTVGGALHKKLLEIGNGKLPLHFVDETK